VVQYPEAARAEGIQGTVPVEVKVDRAGRVSAAKAMGGPKELRQAAVQSASALHFAPEEAPVAGTERVNVEFQLAARLSDPAATRTPEPPVVARSVEVPVRQAPSLRDQGEALLAVLNQASGNEDPAVLDAGWRAGRQLEDRFHEYFGDAANGPVELQVHTVLAYIAETEKNYVAAEDEFRKILLMDPDRAGTSYQLGATILREIAGNNELTRYSEAIYDFARSLAITGPNALDPEEKAAAENALKESYGSYHGGTEGLDELMRQVGASALPPPGFHIASIDEGNESRQQQIRAGWEMAHPDAVDTNPKPKQRGLLVRAFRGVFRFLRHLA
jgi:TonB family protein